MVKRVLFFLVLNLLALSIGGSFTGSGVSLDWYQNLDKAPWTTPGWVFGAALTSIMICYAFYMAYLLSEKDHRKKIIFLFTAQWLLNVAWNPVFFYYKEIFMGFVSISLLTLLIAYFLFRFKKVLRFKTLFIAPYFIWLLIASSLNAYILFYN